MRKFKKEWSLTRNLYAEAYRLQRIKERLGKLAYQNPDKPDHLLVAAIYEIHPVYMGDGKETKAAVTSFYSRECGDLYASPSFQRSRRHAKASGFAVWEKRVNEQIKADRDKALLDEIDTASSSGSSENDNPPANTTETTAAISLYRRFDENWMTDSLQLGRWVVEMDRFADVEMKHSIGTLSNVFLSKKSAIQYCSKHYPTAKVVYSTEATRHRGIQP